MEATATTAPTVFVVDDDHGMRKSLCAVLEAAGLTTRCFASAEEYLQGADSGPGCLVLGLRLTGMNGLELIAHLRSRQVEIPFIIVSGHGNVATVVSAMKLGAVDFFEQPVNHRDLVDGVKLAIASDAVRRLRHAGTKEIHQRLATLTRRERELLGLLAEGKSSKQIALELSRSPKTVENHRTSLLAKMQVQNVAALVAISMRALPATPRPVTNAGTIVASPRRTA